MSGTMHKFQLPHNFTFVKFAEVFMEVTGTRFSSPDDIRSKVVQHFSLRDNLEALVAIVQQMSLMIPEVDPNRIFRSEAHRTEVQDNFKILLTDLYAEAMPEFEEYEWEEDPLGMDSIDKAMAKEEEEIEEAWGDMQKDPELAKIMEMLEGDNT